MIDLRYGLPSSITGNNGEPILLNTDYRVWLQLGEDLRDDTKERDISYIFKGKPPVIDQHIYNQLIMFLYNPSPTPKMELNKDERTLDYILDGEYIYSALYQTYGIDIIDMDMHYHKFLALCNNIIGDNTLWGYAKSMRGYTKPSKNDTLEKSNERARECWALPQMVEKEVIEKVQAFDEYFK